MMNRPVRGRVVEWGGGEERILVDRNTLSYVDGRVVIVPEELWDAVLSASRAVEQALGWPL